ncbi:hypothetical protein Dimus_003800, partial [Dionaea muscipula]
RQLAKGRHSGGYRSELPRLAALDLSPAQCDGRVRHHPGAVMVISGDDEGRRPTGLLPCCKPPLLMNNGGRSQILHGWRLGFDDLGF